MDPTLLAAILSGVMSMVNTGASIGGTSATNKKSISYAKEENENQRLFAQQQADTAFARQKELLNMTNEYSSPSSQMQRYVSAGLNPNLVYGQNANSMSVPSVAAGSTPSALPISIDNPLSPTNLSFARLNEAQIQALQAQAKRDDSSSELNYREAYRIAKLTPAEYDQMVNQSNLLQQTFQSKEFQTAIEQMKLEAMNNNDMFTFENEAGELITADFKDFVVSNDIYRLYADELEYRKAIELFSTEVGIRKAEQTAINLSNKDLAEFVKVCATIYNAQASEASLAAALAEGNAEFWQMFDNKSVAVQAIGKFLQLLTQGVIGHWNTPSVNRPTIINNNMPSNKSKGKKK